VGPIMNLSYFWPLYYWDGLIGLSNELDVGTRALQYVHFPWADLERHETEYRWYHLAPLVHLYRHGIVRLFGLSPARMALNSTLVNSAWTAGHFRALYGTEPRILYPPVPVDRPPLPWSQRSDSFACIGRISREKRILEIIEILAAVRRRGHPVSLVILGQHYDLPYERRVRQAVAAHRDWVSLDFELPRGGLLARVAGCRFGIHGMIGEHFGIAVAEMIRLGLVCFAPEEGGPGEILGDPRLLFASSQDAANKICAVLEDAARLDNLRVHLAGRAELFSAERFAAELRTACAGFDTPGAGA
jgi:glycosyltransferase involved in cell wall biosynthesis